MRYTRTLFAAIFFISFNLYAYSQPGIITKRLQESLISQNISDSETDSFIKNLKPDGSWIDINYKDRSNTNWDPISHCRRLLRICQMYNKPGSPYFHDPGTKDKIQSIIDFYISASPKSDNWWYNAIGAPAEIGPALVLMKSDDGYGIEKSRLGKYASVLLNYFSESAIKWSHATTGANKIWLLGSSISKACIMNNEEVLRENFKSAFEEAAIMPGRAEGIKYDFSFWQHGPQLYGAGYGMSFLSDITYFGTLANGTDYAMTDLQLKVIADAVLDGWQWFCQHGSFDFSAAGREISRQGAVSSLALKNYAGRLISMNAPRQHELKNLIAFIDGKAEFQSPGNRHFWKSDIMVQHGADFYISARVPSSRMNATESMNSENLKRKWLPWGAMNIMTDGDEYHNIYGVWNWSVIPGVTSYLEEIEGLPVKGGAYLVSSSEFAGGVSDGTTGMAAYDYSWDGVSARKAWFFTPDGVYCLGSGITSASIKPVITGVNQCFASGDVTVKEGKAVHKLSGVELTGDISWIWHDKFGYLFPSGGKITVKSTDQTGSWSQINTSQSKEMLTSRIFSTWINHDPQSKSDRYEYIIVPSKDPSRMEKWTRKNPFTLLTNTQDIQAVYNRNSNLYAIALYNPGTVTISRKLYIGADKPCIILYKADKNKDVRITVADPTQKLEKIVLLISAKVGGDGVKAKEDGSSEITVNLPSGDEAGKSVSVDLKFL
jgi:hypothetical protein